MTITHIVDIPEDLRNNLIVALVSLLAGAMIHKVYGKTARLRYSTQIDRLALAADDPIFGSVRVTRGTHGVRNLYMARVDIENTSSRDFENVRFKVYTANETFLLNERTFIPGEPYILEWSPEFKSLLAVVQGGTPTADQFNIYNHTREYRVPVLNRGQVEYRFERWVWNLIAG